MTDNRYLLDNVESALRMARQDWETSLEGRIKKTGSDWHSTVLLTMVAIQDLLTYIKREHPDDQPQ